MKTLCTAALLLALASGSATPAAQADRGNTQPESGWTNLFDGVSIDHFTKRGGDARYSVEDGAIVGETRPNTPNTFLCTPIEYADFILEFEVMVDRELNSGMQVRSHARDNGSVYGYQIEIEATPRGFSGGIYDEGGRGWLAQPTPQQATATPVNPDDWNHYRIEAIGGRIRTVINGIPVADLQDDLVASGFFGLQVHGVGGRTDPLRVRWRNLRIREIN
jgi:opacity protein-like surface antigen